MSFMMKRIVVKKSVVNNKTENQNYFSTSTEKLGSY